jgi:protease-4
MTLETDLLIDRRRLKRRLTFWRALAVLAVVGVLAMAVTIGRETEVAGGSPYVARVTISGVIVENRKLLERITKLAKDPKVEAVLLVIDSSGGTIGGGESLHGVFSTVAQAKPVVAVMRGVAASAGYMIAMPTTRIYAREATITGSIGVMVQTAEVSGLMKTLGVSAEHITSGPLKAEPNMTRPMTPEGRAVLQGLVTDMYDVFVEMVAKGRKMEIATVRQLADGRAYTGRQALKLGLVDAMGGEREARAWLAEEKKIAESLPTRDVAMPNWADRLLEPEGETILGGLWKTLTSQRVMLDGAWAIWQPGRE